MSEQIALSTERSKTVADSLGKHLWVAYCGTASLDDAEFSLLGPQVDFQNHMCADVEQVAALSEKYQQCMLACVVFAGDGVAAQYHILGELSAALPSVARVAIQKSPTSETIDSAIMAGATHVLPARCTAQQLRRALSYQLEMCQESRRFDELLASQQKAMHGIHSGRFEFSDCQTAAALSRQIAAACSKPDEATIGLGELLINAVEHGLANIGSAQKEDLLRSGMLDNEIDKRIASARAQGRACFCTVEKQNRSLVVTIEDPGKGFDYEAHLARGKQLPGALSGRGVYMATDCFKSVKYIDRGNIVRVEIDL